MAKTWSRAAQEQELAPVSLTEVMSEQLATELTREDALPAAVGQEPALEIPDWLSDDDCASDQMLALLLQREFDRLHDAQLTREEQQLNRNSKVALSFDLFRRHSRAHDDDDEDDAREFEFGEEARHWDSFERGERAAVTVGARGFANANGKITTKHDLERSARRNAQKVMELASDLATGDGGAMDMRLNNQVYNSLKAHSISEGKRAARLHEKKEKSTAEKVLDEKSRILLYKLVNSGLLEEVNGIVATGKESVVLHGRGRLEEETRETEVAIKVFKTTLNEFKNRHLYIESDPLLGASAKLSRQKPKLMIPLWAEKEMHNLNRMRRNGILCPQVVILRKHVLVMTFFGADGRASPTLKEAVLDEAALQEAWRQCVLLMCRLYADCDLVHADLSEYNLLWHAQQVVCIDVSQSVLSTHPMAFKFLWRDCQNIHKFFAKRCLPELMTAAELFTKVCGKQLDASDEHLSNSVDFFDKMENYDKSEELLKYGNSENVDPFEDMLQKSLREKTVES